MDAVGILGGLAAALFWGVQSGFNSLATRRSDPQAALLVVMAIALLTVAPAALIAGIPADARAGDWLWVMAAGVGDVLGLSLVFAALQRGALSLVIPIVSAQGAAATVFAVIAGEDLALITTVGLCLVTIGMVAAISTPPRAPGALDQSALVGTALLALSASLALGGALFALGRVSGGVGPIWTLLVLRCVGVVLLVALLAGQGRLSIPRPALRFLVPSALLDNMAFAAYLIATASVGVAVPAVLASQYSVVAVLLGLMLFGEQLTGVQSIGIVIIVVGVSVIAATS